MPQSIDPRMKAGTTIDVYHQAIHNGNGFTASKLYQGVVNGTALDILLRSNADYEWHATINGIATGAFFCFFCASPTVVGSGDALTIFNRNAESSAAAHGTIWVNASISSTGTTAFETLIPGATNKQGFGGGDATSRHEFILKPDTVYLARVYNTSGSSAHFSVEINFYEIEE